ncbi:hypothetical protein [Spirosoma foliorum]|uniref:Uncharacterized protein n=1 Tax=Spirosoma foliorum TaxID=2710596 RepID=A0A7G5H2I9_9BACT|nr:hypothetical protein [Spirosoma foliorum]QMW05331.1 hypothetical protein H3H32_10800 [Spirosoma foliorum]
MQVERAQFLDEVPVSDGGVGTISTEQTVYECNVEVTPIKASRTLEASQDILKQAYLLKMWVTKRYTPKVGSTVIVKGQRLTIQNLTFTDATANRYQLTGLSQ